MASKWAMPCVETARRLGALLPDRQVLARLGGDEFICSTILQPGSEAAIERLALAINDALAVPISSGNIRAEVTASNGIAIPVNDPRADRAQRMQDVRHRADLAMYQAKKSGTEPLRLVRTGHGAGTAPAQ